MKIIQAKVYTFDELSDKAKQEAITDYQRTKSIMDFDFDIQMVVENAVSDLKEIEIYINEKDIGWDLYPPIFEIKSSEEYFNNEVDPVIEKFIESHPGISEVDWSFKKSKFTTYRGGTELRKELIDTTLWNNNAGSSLEKYRTEIPSLIEQMLDAIEPKFLKMMEILEQAKEDIKSDYDWRYSEEWIREEFTENEIYFNKFGEQINVEVLQPTPEVNIQ